MNAMTREFRPVEIALKRMETLCERAANLGEDATKAERMAMIADLDAAVSALRTVQSEIRGRMARSRRCRPAVIAYGRAANILINSRR